MKKLVATGLLLTLLGCSKLTLENYNKIEPGMSFEEVTQLIGEPAKCDDVMGMRSCSWGDEKRSVNVTFAADQVLLFSSNNLR